MRAILDRGGDPLDERDRIKSMPTFSEFVRQEYLPYAYQAKRSAHDDDSKFRLHLEPKWGALRLCDITPRDVQMHHVAMKESHSIGTANRHLSLISATFRKAVEWGVLIAIRHPVSKPSRRTINASVFCPKRRSGSCLLLWKMRRIKQR